MKRAIIWFRRDLRLADNPALWAALERYERVVPVYIHAPGEEQPWDPGGAQWVWLHDSLRALDESLRALGSRLVIRTGDSMEVLNALVSESRADAVFWNRLYEPAPIARDKRIKQGLRDKGVAVESFNAALLHEPWIARKDDGTPYKVFTPYWRKVRELPVDAIDPAPQSMPPVWSRIGSQAVGELALLPRIRWDKGIRETWRPGEARALSMLDTFCSDSLADYPQERDRPDVIGTSRLSPYLHFGEIGPRQIWHKVKRFADSHPRPGLIKAGDAYLRQVCWRDFATQVLYHFPDTPDESMDQRFRDFPWARHYQSELRAWQRGRTGIPMVDAGMRELWHTGWMHNRVRMVVASFLIKNLLIPWQEGEHWFWDTLVDADLANNTLMWQWTAGCGLDAAPYFRIFNPVTQGGRFDPEGAYVARWVPELSRLDKRYVHRPWEAPAEILNQAGVALDKDYPRPLVDLKVSRKRALAGYQAITK